jgi:hypothetical protein
MIDPADRSLHPAGERRAEPREEPTEPGPAEAAEAVAVSPPLVRAPDRGAAREVPGPPPEGAAGLYFYGVVRARGWRLGNEPDAVLTDLQRVRFRDLEALARPALFELPPLDDAHVQAHQRTVEAIMHTATVLPAPYGVVFRGRRQLVSLLQEQYLVIDEGLQLLDGHWELRLHIGPAESTEDVRELSATASAIYSELRRGARAAVPFRNSDKRLLSAAFLVNRATWVEFVDRCEELGAAHPELDFDVTGPWPAYDFVRIL